MSPQAHHQVAKRNSGSLGLAKNQFSSGHNLVSQSMQIPGSAIGQSTLSSHNNNVRKPTQQLKQGGNGTSLSQKALLLHQQNLTPHMTSAAQPISTSASQKQYVLAQPAYIHRAPVQKDSKTQQSQSSQLLQQAQQLALREATRRREADNATPSGVQNIPASGASSAQRSERAAISHRSLDKE